MSPNAWLKALAHLLERGLAPSHRPPPGRGTRFKPRMEALEDRVVPTVRATFTQSVGVSPKLSGTTQLVDDNFLGDDQTWDVTAHENTPFSISIDEESDSNPFKIFGSAYSFPFESAIVGVVSAQMDGVSIPEPFTSGLWTSVSGSHIITITGTPPTGSSKFPDGSPAVYTVQLGTVVQGNGGLYAPSLKIDITVAPGGTGPSTDTLKITRQPPDEVVPGEEFPLTIKALKPNGAVDTKFNGIVDLTLLAPGGGDPGLVLGSPTVQFISGVGKSPTEFLEGQVADANTVGESLQIAAKAQGLAETATTVTKTFLGTNQITLTWTGKGKNDQGKPDPSWSNADNWVDTNSKPLAPVAGGTNYALVFPASAQQTESVDNVSFTANSVSFTGAAPGYMFDIGGGTLTLAGPVRVPSATASGLVVFYQHVALASGAVADITGPSADFVVTFDTVISGAGGLQKDGMVGLEFDRSNRYTGPTTLISGRVVLKNPNPLGTGVLNLTPTSSTAPLVLKPEGSSAVVLGNQTVNWAGTVAVTQEDSPKTRLTFSGPVTVDSSNSNNNSELDVADGGVVVFSGPINPGATPDPKNNTLTVGALRHEEDETPGYVKLAGSVGTTINIRGLVKLGAITGPGTGALNVNGGALVGLKTNTFAGAINVSAGQVEADADNSLGTGVLTFLNGDASHNLLPGGLLLETPSHASLANTLVLNGVTLRVAGRVLISGATVLSDSGNTDLLAITANSTLTLGSGVGPQSSVTTPDSLGEVGKSGVLVIGGQLNSVVVAVPARKNFVASPGLTLDLLALVEDAQGNVILAGPT